VGGPWIPSRDAAGRSLPGILIAFVFAVAFAFVIGFLPDHRFWCANCGDRILERVRDAASDPAWR
jgi:hypothetical protein